MTSENNKLASKDCLKIPFARCSFPAPTACATCTEKPAAHAVIAPPNSHVEEDTKPIEALAPAPKTPTIAASIYCITISEICARMPGKDK